MRPSPLRDSRWRTKFAPMKPAPPVTMRLRGSKLIEHAPQVVAPVMRRDFQDLSRGKGIEHAERGTLGLGRVFLASNRDDGDGAAQQSPDASLLLNGKGK